ncbi:34603_t:CDS:1 [Gigaspora margarita]|uniref:34603_t:CDS:1 n=1 Tax=Gigaspora margarita TaxID=4874 RepID=A0ABN7UKX3_GIGMA|nr:34603_t:CDS:1 [Gigaspora margarita]
MSSKEHTIGPFEIPSFYQPIVQGFRNMVELNGWKESFKKAVVTAHLTETEEMKNIKNFDDYCNFLNYFVLWTPKENENGLMYTMLCTFYFVLDQESVVCYQSPIKLRVYPHEPLTELSQWMVYYASILGHFLDTYESLTEETLNSFLYAKNYRIEDYEEPRDGWRSFNHFFSRNIKKNLDIDETSIVSPADSEYDGSWNIEEDSTIVIKGIKWTINELLAGSKYSNEFSGGKFIYSFLNTFDYHCQHAPVDGKVLEARVIPEQVYLEVKVTKSDGKKVLSPVREVINVEGGLKGEVAPDNPGYQFCQTRGLIIIESKIVGKVAVLPVGMVQVLSVVLKVEEGKKVTKKDEISYFQFGGSDVVMLFQKGVSIVAEKHVHYKVGQKIACKN